MFILTGKTKAFDLNIIAFFFVFTHILTFWITNFLLNFGIEYSYFGIVAVLLAILSSLIYWKSSNRQRAVKSIFTLGSPLAVAYSIIIFFGSGVAGSASMQNRIGIIYAHKDNHKEAIAAYSKAISINPRNADIFINRGLSYYHLGDKKNATIDANRAVKITGRKGKHTIKLLDKLKIE